MALKISRGVESAPVKALIFGTEGVGKTTLASQFPNALILDTEDGSKRLNVARYRCKHWTDLMVAVRELIVDSQGFKTVVIDSADWAEWLCRTHLCEKHGKKSIEEWPYGKGFTLLAETYSQLLEACDKLVDRGLHVVFVAHSKVVRTSPPDETEGFDRYEVDLHKQIAPAVKEWADLILFVNFRTKVVEGGDGRKKAIGGKERLMFAERCAAYDAKNRFGLPEQMPMSFDALAPIFASVAGTGSTPATPAGAESAAVPLAETIRQTIAKAGTVKKLGTIGDRIDALVSEDKLTADEWSELTDLIKARHDDLEPATASVGEEG